MNIDHYRKSPNFSYSSLSALSISPSLYLNRKEDVISDAFRLGSALDCLLTENSKFEENYIIYSDKLPSGQMETYINNMLHFNKKGYKDIDHIHKEAFKKLKKSNPKLRTSDEKFKESFKEFEDYYNINKSNKIILSTAEYKQVLSTKLSIKSNDYTNIYFPSTPDDSVTIYYQYPHFFENYGYNYKVLYDIVYINHKEKTIKALDLKSTSKSILEFPKSFFMYKYYLQQSLYQDGLEVLKFNLGLKDYKIMNFSFIIADLNNYSSPIIYNMSDFTNFGRNGGYYKEEYHKGYLELSKELEYHIKHDVWEFPVEIYKNGEIKIIYEQFSKE